jgi:SOS response regulatory protein OraA/RecX
MRIRQYLAQKGIDKAIIRELLDEQIDEDQQLRIAVEYMEKYLRKRADQDKRRLYSNALGMLARRGFSFELANRAYRIAEESAENPDN